MSSPHLSDRNLESLCSAAIAAQSTERVDAERVIESTDASLSNAQPSPRKCLSITRLSHFADRNVVMNSADTRHIRSCAKCRARLTALRGSAEIAHLPSILRRRSIWTALAAAACVAMLTALPRGTTSPRGPIAATVASYCNLGDVNCDGKVTETDMEAFQLALFDPDLFAVRFPLCDGLCGADANCDGRIDDQDVEPFLFYFEGG